MVGSFQVEGATTAARKPVAPAAHRQAAKLAVKSAVKARSVNGQLSGKNGHGGMGELYQKMSQDLAIKNLAAGTRDQYLRCCSEFARYHMRSPREMGLAEIKDYLGRLVCQGASPEKLNALLLWFRVPGIGWLGTTG
jgi:hypothetical protein